MYAKPCTFRRAPKKIQQQVPAIYLGNYSRAIDLADDLSLVRPDQSYRGGYDAQCEEILDNSLAVYMVYTLEQGDDRYMCPRCFAL